MERDLFNDIVQALSPYMGDVNSRQTLMQSALFGSPVLDKINWTGPAQTFTVHLVQTLMQYGEVEPGKQAIVVVLDTLKGQVGSNHQATINTLITRLASQNSSGAKDMAIEAVGFAFLIEVGKWAMTELKERWTLRRKEQTVKLDTLEEQNLEPVLHPLLKELVSDKGEQEVSHRLELIEMKRNLIRGYEKDLIRLEEALRLGHMNYIQVQAQLDDLHDKIKTKLLEIETDLQALGFDVAKEQV